MSELAVLLFVALLFVVSRLYLRLKKSESRIDDLALRLLTAETKLRQGVAPKEKPVPASPVEPPKAADIPHPTHSSPVPPPLPVFALTPKTAPIFPEAARETVPPALPGTPAPKPKSEPILFPTVTLEAFMGVKLFAWLGGFALFLGFAFLIKYSFEHDLVTPAMRVAIGAATGLGLIVGGLFIPRPKYAVTAQTLCATGVVTLYAVVFGAHALYHFMGLGPTFALMAVITAGAFVLAVKLNAQVIAILGLLGGFLTPILLSTGEDNPIGLFSYIAILDLGMIAVALRQRWQLHVMLAAIATGLLQIGWVMHFFAPSKIGIAATVFLGFEALFLLPFWRSNRDDLAEKWTIAAAGISAGLALAFSAFLLDYQTLGEKPWIVLSIALVADAGLVVWPLRRTALQSAPLLGGAAVFLILGDWNVHYLSDALLYWALGFFLIFAAFHTALPIVLRRFRPAAATPRWAQVFPALGLILMLWPALRIGASTVLWAAVLIADLAAIALAAVTASLLGVVAALVLTLLAVGLWLFQTPVEAPSLMGLLGVIAGFAALFCGASVFLQRRLAAKGLAGTAAPYEREALQHLPAISAVLPFLLLVSVVHRLHPASPNPVFGVALFLIVALLALARWSDTLALPPIALGCAIVLEYTWYVDLQPIPSLPLALAWFVGFTAVIGIFPFLFQSRTSSRVTPWATAALAPILHYPILYEPTTLIWPNLGKNAPGLIPLVLALPALAACDYLRRAVLPENKARTGILAWFGGTALYFITLAFSTQFNHEWQLISWALEGAALCWLYHKLPHWGLRLVGVGLLAVVFIRLTMVSDVLAYHPLAKMRIWNWYLYTYGIGAASCMAGGWLLNPPRHRIGALNVCASLYSLGTILLFLLMNIEIADFFALGPTLTFEFHGNLARDMTYSIAWALFALGLLLVGMHRHLPAVRYAGLGLFVVTLLKLFFHDLASLDQLYRIAAFMIVAVLLIGASYLYQRFLAVDEKKETPPDLPKEV